MAFLATNIGSINERFIVSLQTGDDGVYVTFVKGGAIQTALADRDDVMAFLDKVNAR